MIFMGFVPKIYKKLINGIICEWLYGGDALVNHVF